MAGPETAEATLGTEVPRHCLMRRQHTLRDAGRAGREEYRRGRVRWHRRRIERPRAPSRAGYAVIRRPVAWEPAVSLVVGGDDHGGRYQVETQPPALDRPGRVKIR